jgi:hypothetical protein
MEGLQEEANEMSLDQVFKMNRWTKLRCSPTNVVLALVLKGKDYGLKYGEEKGRVKKTLLSMIYLRKDNCLHKSMLGIFQDHP